MCKAMLVEMYVLVVKLFMCFFSSVNTEHQYDNFCPVWAQVTRYYQRFRYVTVPCDSPRDYWSIPSCYESNIKEVFQTRTYSRNEYNIKEWKCCPGFSRQSDYECVPIVQDCDVNQYRIGDECSECDCDWDNAYGGCREDSGTCFCKPGYIGPRCDSECNDGFFGMDCQYECSCKNNSICNKTDGQCPCTMPGWTGMTCSEACPTSTYGMFCAETCDCSPYQNRFCDPEEGCICNPGYTGESCDEVCPPANWTYGPACRETCMCQRLGSERCDPKSGACSCKPGWEGRFCNDLCGNGTYGLACNQTCQCEVFEECLPTSGDCVCPLGFSGERCHILPFAGHHDFPWGAAVSLIVVALILVAVCVGIFVLARRYRSCAKLHKKRTESKRTQPEADNYTTIADDMDGQIGDHYNSFNDQQPLQDSLSGNQTPYDHINMISGMYDTFHGTQASMVIGDNYDSVRMSNPKASSQYDHMTRNTESGKSKITHVIGSEYDKCEHGIIETSHS
ncbi:protein draper-like isoform X2 [Pecten maximus]|uniref:protein draper-like isoform X2 n=1 Tax=Pecten maximus TaxID=6579 RepID=UPI0014582745|nr:protein draper-like isoform X2 [Pecten maximus]